MKLTTFIALVLFAVVAWGGEQNQIKEGQQINPIVLPDQNDSLYQVNRQTRLILYTRHMDFIAEYALKYKDDRYLSSRRVVYIADISGMHQFTIDHAVLNFMRGHYSYPVLLDRNGQVTSQLPSYPGYLTLIYLNNLTVTAIDSVNTAEEVLQAIEALPISEADVPDVLN